MFRPWIVAAGLAIVLAAVAVGYRRGAADCQANYQARELAHIEASRKLDEARRAAERAREVLSLQFEEEAHADLVSVPECLGAGRVRRLNSLR